MFLHQYYRRNRYYDAGTGRFTQEDPIGLAGGINLYGYANGDPVSYRDPYGLSADTVWVGIRNLAVPVLGALVSHSSVRANNDVFELTNGPDQNSVVKVTSFSGNTDMDAYTWYRVDAPAGMSDTEFTSAVRFNATQLGGSINTTGQKYEALGRNCHWYTNSVITPTGARIPGEAEHSNGRLAPNLCSAGTCTVVENPRPRFTP